MAPERTARAGGLSLPGMRNSALASAALTSVALLAQTANAAPPAGDETPSRDEVRQRVSSLYDQAEYDSGTFNATRASGTAPRGRASRPAGDGRRPAGVARGDERRGGDPALDNVTRQWFDVARSKLGPTVPAALPSDRRPTGTTPSRPARPAERAGDGRADGGREVSGRAVRELPAGSGAPSLAGPVAELTSGPATGTAPMAELTAAPTAALPTVPEAAPEATRAASLALPAPTAEPDRSALRAAKEQNQGKLARARELLSAYAARQSMQLPVIETPSTEDTWAGTTTRSLPEAGTAWQGPQGQQGWQTGQSTDLATTTPTTPTWPATDALGIDTGAATYGQGFDTSAATYGQDIGTSAATYGQNIATSAATYGQDIATSAATYGQDIATSAALLGGQAATTTSTFGQGINATAATYGQSIDATASTSGQGTGTAATTYGQGIDTSAATHGQGTATAASTHGQGIDMSPAANAQPLGMAPAPAPTSATAQDSRAEQALAFARAQVGKPCVVGTTGPDSFDGAGLTQAAWKAAGIELPRTPQEQALAGRGVALAYLEPGDLVLFHVGHVGIYTGNGQMIHAPGPGAYIREESIQYAGEAAIHSAIRPV
jgi:cell wall-associated NlpC family hydrolase